MALIPYSVSPCRNDHRRGPKPTKNSSTLIPNHLATPKWAASWITITTTRATKNATWATVPAIQPSVGVPRRSSRPADRGLDGRYRRPGRVLRRPRRRDRDPRGRPLRRGQVVRDQGRGVLRRL